MSSGGELRVQRHLHGMEFGVLGGVVYFRHSLEEPVEISLQNAPTCPQLPSHVNDRKLVDML